MYVKYCENKPKSEYIVAEYFEYFEVTHRNNNDEVISGWSGDTIILVKSVGVSKLQVAILARSSREMSKIVRID